MFAGGCALEAAQQVAGDAELDPWEVVEQLATLVDRSLVQAEGGAAPRYRLLETARLFALQQLREAGAHDALRERHARAGRSADGTPGRRSPVAHPTRAA